MAKTIFISGASMGLGKRWAESFLKERHIVVVASRDLSTLDVLAAH